MRELLNSDARRIIDAVTDIISPAYLVGGSVRDILLGENPSDYDFSTPLLPDQVEIAVAKAGKKPYLIGKRFGTIGFKIHGHPIEVTTFRLEAYLPGSRKPQVQFVDDITHDLSRRDFTINAMAMREDGTIIDPFGGRADLNDKIIRTVNKPYDRYNEDPLRMLRAARFAAQLGFSLETETKLQASRKAAKILEVSKERWTLEIDKLITAPHPRLGLEFLSDTMLLNFMIPELAIQVDFDQDSPYHELDLWSHTLKTVELTNPDLTLRWAALLHDIGKPYVKKKNKKGYSNYTHHENVGGELVTKIGPYLKWPSARTKEIADLVYNHLEAGSPLHAADFAATKA